MWNSVLVAFGSFCKALLRASGIMFLFMEYECLKM